MPLITDANIVETRELLPYENDLLETADRERVELDSKIALATSEVIVETELELARLEQSGGGDTAGLSVDQVVVTEALARWLHSHCLELIYFECFGHQMNERFREKHEHYQRMAEKAKQGFLGRGIGIVNQPLAKPARPTAVPVSGVLSAGAYFVAVTWTGANGAESAPSVPLALQADGTQGFEIRVAGVPTGATGWHVYAGTDDQYLYRQTTNALDTADFWTQSSEPVAGALAGTGQKPDRYVKPQRIFLRG